MLHVTNGDVAAEGIVQARFDGEVLPWRDVLHEGPVPAVATAEELREVRARFLARCGWTEVRTALEDLTARDRRLERALVRGEELVLWFEPDLYDQLQLLQVLDRVARSSGRSRISGVFPGESIGPMSSSQLVACFARARDLGAAEVEVGRRAWEAFRDPDPRKIERLLAEDLAPLPDLADALLRHLEQFPSVAEGLSRSERQILGALLSGPKRFEELFREAQAAEHHHFVGDAVFEHYLAELSAAAAPLVRRSTEGEWSITQLGEAIFRGRSERVATLGLDRWLGGVWLHSPRRVWRWDRESGALVPPF